MPRDRALSAVTEGREPHSLSLKVLRLSRPSLAHQHPVSVQTLLPSDQANQLEELSYGYPSSDKDGPFILSSLLTFPPAFGSAYVGEQFSCCLCVNACNIQTEKVIDVKVTAQIQTPSLSVDLTLLDEETLSKLPKGQSSSINEPEDQQKTASKDSVVLSYKETFEKIVKHDLKEEGNHVLSVTVAYGEAPNNGEEPRYRTFRKLYQFVVMQCLTVRTKTGELPVYVPTSQTSEASTKIPASIILEAQLENMAESPISLEVVNLHPRKGWLATSLNWENSALEEVGDGEVNKFQVRNIPMLKHRDVMQVAFLLQPDLLYADRKDEPSAQLKIEWRSAWGDKGYLSTGYLSAKKK